jgi:hypothetical protein
MKAAAKPACTLPTSKGGKPMLAMPRISDRALLAVTPYRLPLRR